MRKLIAVLITVVCIVMLAGCGAKSSPEVAIDYGNSSIYSKEDMDSAIQMIKKEFDTWDGCELHSITYGTDEMQKKHSRSVLCLRAISIHQKKAVVLGMQMKSILIGNGGWHVLTVVSGS